VPFVRNIGYISLYFFVLFRLEYWDPHEVLNGTYKCNFQSSDAMEHEIMHAFIDPTSV
jgi:hypothetical protein